MATSTTKRTARHRFAPLNGSPPKDSNDSQEGGDSMQLQGIIFDMDGTLCEPQNHMFAAMREAVSIPAHSDILDHIHALPAAEQERAFAKIQAIEREAMAAQVPQPGLVTLMDFLDQRGVLKGICTRNFDAPVSHLLSTHIPSHIKPFSPIITRDFRPPKPSPEALWHIARAWAVDLPPNPSSTQLLPLVMVGDSVDDMAAGYEAGALTVLLRSPGKEELETDERTDVVVDRLDELVDLLAQGLGGR